MILYLEKSQNKWGGHSVMLFHVLMFYVVIFVVGSTPCVCSQFYV